MRARTQYLVIRIFSVLSRALSLPLPGLAQKETQAHNCRDDVTFFYFMSFALLR